MTLSIARARLAILVAATSLAGCVTINIYFPEAAAERAADRIIDDVWQLKDGTTEPPKENPPAPANP